MPFLNAVCPYAKGFRPQMSDPTEIVDRQPRVTSLQLRPARTLIADMDQPAFQARVVPDRSLLPYPGKKLVPPLGKGPMPQIVTGCSGHIAQAELSVRVDMKAPQSGTAAEEVFSIRFLIFGSLIEASERLMPLRIFQVQLDYLLRGDPQSPHVLTSVEPPVEESIEAEFQPEVLNKPLGGSEFVSVLIHDYRFKLQRNLPLLEEIYSSPASLVRTRHFGHLLIGTLRGAVKSDFYEAWGKFLQKIHQRRGNQGAIGEKGDKKALFLCIEVDIFEVRPQQRFPSCQEQPESSLFGHIVKEAVDFSGGKLFFPCLLMVSRLIHIAVEAAVIAPEGELESSRQRDSLTLRTLDQPPGIILNADFINAAHASVPPAVDTGARIWPDFQTILRSPVPRSLYD
jgi:hypothetical protein